MTLCVLSLKQESAKGSTKKKQATTRNKQSAKSQPRTSANDRHKQRKNEGRIATEKMHEISETEDATIERQLPNFDEEISTDFRYITGDEGSLSEDDDDDTFPAYVPSFLNTNTTPGVTSKALDDFARDLLGSDEQGGDSGNKDALPKQGKATYAKSIES